jgi:hypothetical protein
LLGRAARAATNVNKRQIVLLLIVSLVIASVIYSTPNVYALTHYYIYLKSDKRDDKYEVKAVLGYPNSPITWGDDSIQIYGHIASPNSTNLDNRIVMVQAIESETGLQPQRLANTDKYGKFNTTFPTSQEGNIIVTAYLIGEDSKSDTLRVKVTNQSWTPVVFIIIFMVLGLGVFIGFWAWGSRHQKDILWLIGAVPSTISFFWQVTSFIRIKYLQILVVQSSLAHFFLLSPPYQLSS